MTKQTRKIPQNIGRPSTYSQEIASAICERLANGVPMATICSDPAMPSYSTVWNWEQNFPEFLEISARAKQHGTHYLADDCVRISDDPKIDPAHKRIMVDTRLRLIGKWHAKAYGDKQAVDVTGTVSLESLVLAAAKQREESK